jgi:hypothetical protein
LESKVGSPLSRDQLRKYKKKGCEYLIAVTKHYPEVLPDEIEAIGAFALRWQDIHRSIAESTARRPSERFLRREFLAYLEELDMAHRENITRSDLIKLAKILSALRSSNGQSTLSDSFRTAEAAAGLLEAVRERLQEKHSALRKWAKSGPYCGYNTKDNNYHAYVGWDLRHRTSSRTFCLAFAFPKAEDGPPFVDAWLYGQDAYAKLSLKAMMKDHVVSEDKLFNFAESHAKKWGVIR